MTDKSALCKDCASFKMHGTKCWYYWEHKRACTQFKPTELDEPGYQELKE